jgi:DNA-binding NarL/FixJ family response regulator
VLATSPQLAQELAFLATIQATQPRVGIVVCVLPGSPAPAQLWPLLRQLEPESFCTLAEPPGCLAALAERRAYYSGLLSVFSQLAAAESATVSQPQVSFPEEFSTLTASEGRVVQAILHGLCRRETAATLFISPRMVDNHKASIARKLGTVALPYSLTKFVFQHKELLVNWLEYQTAK